MASLSARSMPISLVAGTKSGLFIGGYLGSFKQTI
jgi:hypothetical protein